MGIALGCTHLSYDDFYRMTPTEFNAVYKSWSDRSEAERRDRWECMRMLATISIQPYVKNKIEPQKLLPFAWDKKRSQAKRPKLTPEELKARKERAAAVLGATY